MLVRNGDLPSILDTLIASGAWEPCEHDFEDAKLLEVPRLKRLDPTSCPPFLSLWSEAIYHLKVEDCRIPVPELFRVNSCLLEEQFHPEPTKPHDPPDTFPPWCHRPFLLGCPNIRFCSKPPARRRTASTPIFVPALVPLIEALFAQQASFDQAFPEKRVYRPMVHINYFIRYLKLEMPTQREKSLPLLSPAVRVLLEPRLDNYKRKRLAQLPTKPP